jgi:hypothetical protein
MYQMTDPGLWREHRRELLREAEVERLARQLRARRPKKVARIRTALLGRVGGRAVEDTRCA